MTVMQIPIVIDKFNLGYSIVIELLEKKLYIIIVVNCSNLNKFAIQSRKNGRLP